MTTELDIARAISARELPSPTPYQNCTLFAVRISGTGVAFRPKVDEFVYRPPRVWLTDEMARRVAGLPVVAEHPDVALLDGDSFYNRVVGTVIHAFPRYGELWGICRIIDERAAAILKAGEFDTSPAVSFAANTNSTVDLGSGLTLLLEEEPELLDHLALIDMSRGNRGVWNRDGADAGVDVKGG